MEAKLGHEAVVGALHERLGQIAGLLIALFPRTDEEDPSREP